MKITLCTNTGLQSTVNFLQGRVTSPKTKGNEHSPHIHSHFNHYSLSTVAILTCILSAKIVASQWPFKERMMYKLRMM